MTESTGESFVMFVCRADDPAAADLEQQFPGTNLGGSNSGAASASPTDGQRGRSEPTQPELHPG